MIIIPEDVLRIAEALSAPIEEMGLSVRSYNGLMRWGITTVADVYRAYQDKQLPRIRNLGEKSVIEIEKHLEEHLAKVAPANTSEIPNSSDCISRQAAIDICLQYCPDDDGTCSKNGDDLRNMLDEIEELPSAQPAPREDAVSRKAVAGIYTALWEIIGTIMDRDEWDDVCKTTANELPPAQLAPDNNGDLWVTVPDIDEVTCIYVQESKSKFCRIFYEERI